MAWTAPLTASTNATLTAAQYNTHCRDNFLMMEAAKATGTINAQETFCLMMCDTAAANSVVERAWAHSTVEASETVTATSYTDGETFGPSITVTTSTEALVFFGATIQNDTVNVSASTSVAVSGASTVAASDSIRLDLDGITAANAMRRSGHHHFTGLTAGANTFTMQYKVAANTGTFTNRHLAVWAL